MFTHDGLKNNLQNFLDSVDAGTHDYQLRLIAGSLAWTPDDYLNWEWADLSGVEAYFDGYAPIVLVGTEFGAITADGDTEYVESATATWSSGGAYGSTTPITHIVLTREPVGGGTVEMLDVAFLGASYVCDVAGVVIQRKYRRVSRNCTE